MRLFASRGSRRKNFEFVYAFIRFKRFSKQTCLCVSPLRVVCSLAPRLWLLELAEHVRMDVSRRSEAAGNAGNAGNAGTSWGPAAGADKGSVSFFLNVVLVRGITSSTKRRASGSGTSYPDGALLWPVGCSMPQTGKHPADRVRGISERGHHHVPHAGKLKLC